MRAFRLKYTQAQNLAWKQRKASPGMTTNLWSYWFSRKLRKLGSSENVAGMLDTFKEKALFCRYRYICKHVLKNSPPRVAINSSAALHAAQHGLYTSTLLPTPFVHVYCFWFSWVSKWPALMGSFAHLKSITVHACNIIIFPHPSPRKMGSPNDNSLLKVASKIDCIHPVTLLNLQLNGSSQEPPSLCTPWLHVQCTSLRNAQCTIGLGVKTAQ